MASKTHDFHDYSFGSAHARPRQVWYRREDPVELPRTSVWRAGGGALVAAAAVAALALGSAYAAFREPPPQLVEQTPALPPIATWQPDAAFTQAHVINMLQGPARSVPEKAATPVATETENEVPWPSGESPSPVSRAPGAPSPEAPSFASPAPESRDLIGDDSKLYPPAPAPYPDPTTTPPEAIAPSGPGTMTSPSDAENPYQD